MSSRWRLSQLLRVYLSPGWGVLVGSLLFLTLIISITPQNNLQTLFSRAQNTSVPLKVTVSTDNVVFSEAITVIQGGGYHIKTDPPINGYLEARSPKPSDPSGYKIFQWNESVGGTRFVNGVGYVNPHPFLAKLAPGVYRGEFRPNAPISPNKEPWSNPVTVTLIASESAQSNKKVRVLSFNVLKGYEAFCGGTTQATQLAQTVQFVTEGNYDIVFLQESECNQAFAQAWQDSLRTSSPQARVYFARVQYLWAFDKQIAIFSRYPLVNKQINTDVNMIKPVEVQGDTYSYLDSSEHRRILNVVSDIEGVRVRLMGIHPSPSGCSQIQNEVRGYVEQFPDYPIIMAGDFNCSTRSISQSATSWIKNTFQITCLSPEYETDTNCGESTKTAGKFSPWRQSNMGAIDHIAVSKSASNAGATLTLQNGVIVRDRRLAYSDHNPASADISLVSRRNTAAEPGENTLCSSWTSVTMNNCTYDKYFQSPRSPECTTSTPLVTLKLNAPWASTIKWGEVDASVFCNTQDDSNWHQETYAPEKRVAIPSLSSGEKKLCVTFSSPSQKSRPCGSIIEYRPLLTPAPLPDNALSVVSYNMLAASKTKNMRPSLESVYASIQEGNRWDLVGLQELAEFPNEGISKIQDFKTFFLQKGIAYYCETQRAPHWLFKSSMCSRYPFVPDSYREYRIYTYRGDPDKTTGQKHARVLQCALVKAPVKEVIFCNTHTQAQAIGEQRGVLKDLLTKTVLQDYIPAGTTTSQREEWMAKNKARLIVTGDFNSNPTEYVTGLAVACDKNRSLCEQKKTGWYIDHVAYFPSAPAGISVLSATRDFSKNWYTDHESPVLVKLQLSTTP